jgi:predicted Zn finger-like uncharacterized protein
MDVRCEKCMTVYEFDDSQVGENGVTVKCTQCGNLFKVKRRATTAELALVSGGRSPAYVPPTPTPTPTPQPAPPQPAVSRQTARGVPVPSERPGPPRPSPPAAPAAPTVQQAAPPQPQPPPQRPPPPRPTPPAPTVQAKRAPTPAKGNRQDEDLALTTTAPMSQLPSFDGPSAMGDNLLGGDDPAFAQTAPKPRITPPPHMAVPTGSHLGLTMDDFEEEPRRGRSSALYLGVGAAVVVLLGAGFLLRGKLGGTDGGKLKEQIVQAHNLFLLDTEDAFHQAAGQLQQLHGREADNALVLAALGELDATRAGYLRDDAREMEAKGGAAVEPATRQMRKQAQQHLDDAKRYTGDALALAPDAPEVNRAMAEFLRVDGAPLAEAERYLKRALDKRSNDAESVFAQGALLFREGRLDEARTKLEQANALHLGATQKPLFRALYLLGKLEAQASKREDARRHLTQLTSLNPQHERGRALLATLDAAPAASPPPVAVAAAPTGPAAPAAPTGAVAAVTATGVKKPAPLEAEEVALAGTDYKKLVQQADRLSENGRTEQARKLYEKALASNPNGVEALTGLERFMAAVDHFKHALQVVPEYGEALIGLAEAHKVRGDKLKAVEFYKRYLKAQPGGAKAAMVQKNVRDIEAHLPPPEAAAVPEPKEKDEAPRKAVDKPGEKIEKGPGNEEKSELPRPPTPSSDEPPP